MKHKQIRFKMSTNLMGVWTNIYKKYDKKDSTKIAIGRTYNYFETPKDFLYKALLYSSQYDQ